MQVFRTTARATVGAARPAPPLPCGVDMMPASAGSDPVREPDPLRVWVGNLLHGISQVQLMQELSIGGVEGNNDTTVKALSSLGNL